MDKIEKVIKENLQDSMTDAQLDIDALLDSTHHKIKKRAMRRKAIYTSPAIVLVLLIFYFAIPGSGPELSPIGGELMIVGWEDSWTEMESAVLDDAENQVLIEQSIDYLTNVQSADYGTELNEIIDTDDIDEFVSFLREA